MRRESTGFPFCDRTFAESLLGERPECKVYRTHGSTAQGIAMLRGGACPAYILDGGSEIVAVICRRGNGEFKPVLGDPARRLSQSDIAEAVDFWEKDNDNQLFSLYEKSCGAVIFTDRVTDGKKERLFLLIRMNLGHCGLPKGHVEKFETEEQAAIREIAEETGVHAKLYEGFREVVSYHITPKTVKDSVYFVGRFDDSESVTIQPSEIRSYRLCPYAEAREAITHDNDRAMFDRAAKWLADHGI